MYHDMLSVRAPVLSPWFMVPTLQQVASAAVSQVLLAAPLTPPCEDMTSTKADNISLLSVEFVVHCLRLRNASLCWLYRLSLCKRHFLPRELVSRFHTHIQLTRSATHRDTFQSTSK